MLVLTLPAKASAQGQCRINGRNAEYELHSARIKFRHSDCEAWSERNILDRQPCGELTTYICDDGTESHASYSVFTGVPTPTPAPPCLTKDHEIQTVDRDKARIHKVCGKFAFQGRTMIVCGEVGFPVEMEPAAEVLHAAQWADAGKIGDVFEVDDPTPTGRRLVLGSKVAMEVTESMPPIFGPVGTVLLLPLVIGFTSEGVG